MNENESPLQTPEPFDYHKVILLLLILGFIWLAPKVIERVQNYREEKAYEAQQLSQSLYLAQKKHNEEVRQQLLERAEYEHWPKAAPGMSTVTIPEVYYRVRRTK